MNSRRNQPSKPTTTGTSPPQEHGHVTPSRATTPHVNISPGVRKKSTGIRQWLLVDSTGQGQVVEAGKHTVMRRTGLSARDLCILDPMLSYPSTVLGRERAIVINLEHIKAIITAYEVLLLNSTDPFVVTFVEELQRRIMRRCGKMGGRAGTGTGQNGQRAQTGTGKNWHGQKKARAKTGTGQNGHGPNGYLWDKWASG
ncbi:magnesium transporter MRS2-3-like protein [Tanacetum coccineum]